MRAPAPDDARELSNAQRLANSVGYYPPKPQNGSKRFHCRVLYYVGVGNVSQCSHPPSTYPLSSDQTSTYRARRGGRQAMIRAQSLALQCARESARSRAFGKAGGKACAPCQILRCCGGSSTRQAFVDGGGRRAQPAEGGAGNRYHTAARSLHWNEAVNSDTGGMIYVRHPLINGSNSSRPKHENYSGTAVRMMVRRADPLKYRDLLLLLCWRCASSDDLAVCLFLIHGFRGTLRTSTLPVHSNMRFTPVLSLSLALRDDISSS